MKKSGRLFTVPVGTVMKIIEYDDGRGIVAAQHYEARVMEGKHKDKKGYMLAVYLRHRVAVPEKPRRKNR